MRFRYAYLAIFAACLFQAPSATADEAETIAEVRAAVEKIDKAFADQDVATIESMFTPDHISIAARYGGAIRTDDQLEAIGALERKAFDLTPVDVVLIAPGAALVTYQQSYTGTYQDEPLPPRVFVTQIWLDQDGKWLQRLYQESPIASP